jgi:hypothetical protein
MKKPGDRAKEDPTTNQGGRGPITYCRRKAGTQGGARPLTPLTPQVPSGWATAAIDSRGARHAAPLTTALNDELGLSVHDVDDCVGGVEPDGHNHGGTAVPATRNTQRRTTKGPTKSRAGLNKVAQEPSQPKEPLPNRTAIRSNPTWPGGGRARGAAGGKAAAVALNEWTSFRRPTWLGKRPKGLRGCSLSNQPAPQITSWC